MISSSYSKQESNKLDFLNLPQDIQAEFCNYLSFKDLLSYKRVCRRLSSVVEVVFLSKISSAPDRSLFKRVQAIFEGTLSNQTELLFRALYYSQTAALMRSSLDQVIKADLNKLDLAYWSDPRKTLLFAVKKHHQEMIELILGNGKSIDSQGVIEVLRSVSDKFSPSVIKFICKEKEVVKSPSLLLNLRFSTLGQLYPPPYGLDVRSVMKNEYLKLSRKILNSGKEIELEEFERTLISATKNSCLEIVKQCNRVIDLDELDKALIKAAMKNEDLKLTLRILKRYLVKPTEAQEEEKAI